MADPLDLDLGSVPAESPRKPKASTMDFTAYKREAELFERALASPRGIRITLSYRQAIPLRVKLHRYKKMLRVKATEVYASDDPRWGTSPFDHLRITIPQKPESNDTPVRLTIEPRPIDEEPVVEDL